MTAIVAVVDRDGNAIIGGDSAVSLDENTHLEIQAESKVWRVGDYLMGASGWARGCNIARYVFTPPKPRARSAEALDRFMCTTFVDAYRDAMLRGGHTFKEEQSRESIETELLVVVRGTIYTIYQDFDMERPRSAYAAIGCGTRPALGALFATEHMGATRKRVELALRAAEAYDAAVRRPWAFIEMPAATKKAA